MSLKASFRKRFFRLLIAVAVAVCFSPSVALAVDITSGNSPYTHSGTSTSAHVIDKNDEGNITMTNDGTITKTGNNAVKMDSVTNPTLTNNAGAVIETVISSGTNGNNAVKATSAVKPTIINSGTIYADRQYAIFVNRTTGGGSITNNSGGIIYSPKNAIADGTVNATSNLTITNSGQIYITSEGAAITLDNLTGSTIINNAGGEIYSGSGDSGTGATLTIGPSSSITNSGQIRDDSGNQYGIQIAGNDSTLTNNVGGLITGEVRIGTDKTGITITNSGSILNNVSPANTVISIKGSNNTVILKDGGIVVGTITVTAGKTDNKLQLDHGFGRAYFYETSGDFTLEDLSGNTVVKGSAGSVSLGRQETVDELLGLRTYNLRSTLKRYASAPKPSDKNMVWGETFGYSSKRGGTDTLLEYDTYGYGMNFIHPVTSKLDLILSVEQNDLDFPEDYEVSRTGFLAGVNVSEFSGFGKSNWKAGGFAVAGMGWHNSKREILTNTTASGLLDVTADYKSLEVMTGLNINHSYQSPSKGWMKNRWDTEIGFTLQGSRTGDYNEDIIFSLRNELCFRKVFTSGNN